MRISNVKIKVCIYLTRARVVLDNLTSYTILSYQSRIQVLHSRSNRCASIKEFKVEVHLDNRLLNSCEEPPLSEYFVKESKFFPRALRSFQLNKVLSNYLEMNQWRRFDERLLHDGGWKACDSRWKRNGCAEL